MTTEAFRDKLTAEMKEFAPSSLNDELWKCSSSEFTTSRAISAILPRISG